MSGKRKSRVKNRNRRRRMLEAKAPCVRCSLNAQIDVIVFAKIVQGRAIIVNADGTPHVCS